MQTYEQIRVHINNRIYPLVALKWGGSITAGIPKAVVNTSSSALAGEASLMLGANQTRRPAPDMFPGIAPGNRIYLEVFIDEQMVTSTPFLITDVVFTRDEVKIDFSTNSLSFSNPVRLAPLGEYMPQGWGRGDGDASQRWASSLGAVSPGTSPGWAAFWAMRVAGYHCVPMYDDATTIIDVPCQWTNSSEAWNMNGGHTITCFAQGNLYEKSTLVYQNGMTFMSSGAAWFGGTVEGRRNWGQHTEISGHFMWGEGATGTGEFTIITGGGNWVSFNPEAGRGLKVWTSSGENSSFPAGTIPPNAYVQVSVSTTRNRWRCKIGNVEKSGAYYATINDINRETKDTWFTGLKIVAHSGARFAGLQVRTGYLDNGHYLDRQLNEDSTFNQTAFIEIPLSGLVSRATPSVRDDSARDVLNELAEALCASWWVDEEGVCQFRDMKSLQQRPAVRTIDIDTEVADYQLSGEDTVNRDAVEVKYTDVAYSRNQLARVRVYEGRGATISNDDENEELITPKENEEWLAVDWTISWYNKWANPKPDLSMNSWTATTVKEGAGSTRQSMKYVNPWTYIYRAWTHTDANDKFSAQYEVDGQKFPLIQARGLMQYTPVSKRYGSSWAKTPFVHNGGRWVTSPTVADNIGNWLLNLSNNPIPMRGLSIVYSPRLKLGDVINLSSGDASFTTRKLQITQVNHDPANMKTDLQVVEISSADAPELTWDVAEGNARRAGSPAVYQNLENRRAGSEPTWNTVQNNPVDYPYGV